VLGLPIILEGIADFAGTTKNPDDLSELVRRRLGMYFVGEYESRPNVIRALTLDPRLEQALASRVHRTPGDVGLALDPVLGRHLLEQLSKGAAALTESGAPSVVAAMSGEVQYLFNPMSTSLSVFKSGKLRLIAVTGLQRDALAPAIPTIAESGYPGFEALFWIGIVAPAATPRAVVELLGNESQKILRTPEMKEALAKLGSSPFITSSADFGKLIGSEFEKWSALAVKANIKPE
jgi:hypothetical protein